jgi:hypothetical protein
MNRQNALLDVGRSTFDVGRSSHSNEMDSLTCDCPGSPATPQKDVTFFSVVRRSLQYDRMFHQQIFPSPEMNRNQTINW